MQLQAPDFSIQFFTLPNEVIDDILPHLSDSAFKIYIFLIRKIKGWRKHSDAVALSQFTSGTGKSKPTVLKALSELHSAGLVHHEKACRKTTVYSLIEFSQNSLPPSKNPLPDSSKESLQGLSKESLHTKDILKNNSNTSDDDFNKWINSYPKTATNPDTLKALFDQMNIDARELQNQTSHYLSSAAVVNEFPRFVKRPENFLLQIYKAPLVRAQKMKIYLSKKQQLIQKCWALSPTEIREPELFGVDSDVIKFMLENKIQGEQPKDFLDRMEDSIA